jgi:hypothetical protein
VTKKYVPLDGPYVDFIRAESTRYWNDLAKEYKNRNGETVPLLTEDDVRDFALRHNLKAGHDRWLAASHAVAASYRTDLRREEFQRLVALAATQDRALRLRPQPIEILVAIEAIRPPDRASQRQSVEITPTRRRGRPGWDIETYRKHLAEAQREAEKNGDDPTRLSHVAKYFKNLHGEPDVDIGWLRRLNRRFLPA